MKTTGIAISSKAASSANEGYFTSKGLIIRLAPGLVRLAHPVCVWLFISVSAFALPLTLITLILCIVRFSFSNSHPGAMAAQRKWSC